MTDTRACCKCGAPITACMGFVKVGDMLDAWDGKRTELPRELCGRCVEQWRWTEAGTLEPKPLEY